MLQNQNIKKTDVAEDDANNLNRDLAKQFTPNDSTLVQMSATVIILYIQQS